MKYLAAIMARGHSIEYFIEGGRSRTGRLLQPKTGMLSMTVRSFLRDPVRPVVFVPVYFGYERIVEANTYISELSGAPKKKESWLDLLLSLRVLRERFGTVHVNVGRAHPAQRPARRARCRAGASSASTTTRARRRSTRWSATWPLSIMRGINAAAAVTPINLLATALLATPRGALPESALLRQLELYSQAAARCALQRRGSRVTDATPAEIVVVRRVAQDHLARASQARRRREDERRERAAHRLLPQQRPAPVRAAVAGRLCVHRQLHAAHRGHPAPGVAHLSVRRLRAFPALARGGAGAAWSTAFLLRSPSMACCSLTRIAAPGCAPPPDSPAAMQLSMLAQATIQTIERYYLAIALLLKAGSGAINQKALEQQCQLAAQRMNMLYGFNSPGILRSRPVRELHRPAARTRRPEGRRGRQPGIRRGAGAASRADAQLVLSEQIRHSILQVTQV